MQTEYWDTLAGAVTAAFLKAQHDINEVEIDAASHLMAQRRILNGGAVIWAVEFSDRFDNPWLTHLFSSTAETQGTEADIVAKIEAVWDQDWDEVQIERPAGDFSLSSSDFSSRGAGEE